MRATAQAWACCRGACYGGGCGGLLLPLVLHLELNGTAALRQLPCLLMDGHVPCHEDDRQPQEDYASWNAGLTCGQRYGPPLSARRATPPDHACGG